MLVLLPICLFLLIFLPYLFLIPGGDGNVEFKFAQHFADGSALKTWIPYHPPIKLFLFATFFHLFGYWSIGFVGAILGSIGIWALYTISREIFDKKVALLSAFLLATSGLYLSVGLFSVNDFVMTVFILVAFAFYVRSRYGLYSLFACLAVMTKETAIFFALSVLIVELLQKRKKFMLMILPVVLVLIWFGMLRYMGFKPWNFYNFSPTASAGSAYTMIANLVTLHIFNKFAYENWLHLFVFNFNWVMTIFAGIGLYYLRGLKKRKELLVIGIFFVSFTVLVLSFQTWTINRYTLPLLPFLYMFASYGVSKLHYSKILIAILLVIAVLSLSRSSDPVSDHIWKKTAVANEQLYLYQRIDGGDGITYNAQYLNLMKDRTVNILHDKCSEPMLLLYDIKTLKTLGVNHCR